MSLQAVRAQNLKLDAMRAEAQPKAGEQATSRPGGDTLAIASKATAEPEAAPSVLKRVFGAGFVGVLGLMAGAAAAAVTAAGAMMASRLLQALRLGGPVYIAMLALPIVGAVAGAVMGWRKPEMIIR